MHLFDLPEELLSQCCSTTDVKSLRLTCKRFSLLFAPQLFRNIQLLPTPGSAKKALSVLKDDRLSLLVTEIYIRPHTWEDGYNRDPWEDPNPCWKIEALDNNDCGEPLVEILKPSKVFGVDFDRENEDEDSDAEREGNDDDDEDETSEEMEKELSAFFKRVIHEIGRFKNLRRVTLKHTDIVHEPSLDTEDSEAPESLEYRTKILREVLRGLNHPHHPASKLDGLRVEWMQDFVDAELATCDDFKAVMSRLQSLQLSVTSWQETQEIDDDISRDIELPEQHVFFGRDLRRFWLEPLQDRLLHLELTGRSAWGYVPKCDLRGLHFPKLKSLVLGEMTFTHDWQFEWILSHGKTLSSLTLDECPIIHATWIGHTLDNENYPIFTLGQRLKWEREDGDANLNYWTYEGRWHTWLRKFKAGLPFLREIKMINWLRSWSEAAQEKNGSKWARYCIFFSAGWACEGQVQLPKGDDKPYFGGLNTDYLEPEPWYPDCWEEDQKAFEELLEVVRRRRQISA